VIEGGVNTDLRSTRKISACHKTGSIFADRGPYLASAESYQQTILNRSVKADVCSTAIVMVQREAESEYNAISPVPPVSLAHQALPRRLAFSRDLWRDGLF